MNSSKPMMIDSIEYLLQLSQQVDKDEHRGSGMNSNTNITKIGSQPLVSSEIPVPAPVLIPIQAPISNIDSLLIKFPRDVNISNLMNTYLDHELRLICSFKKLRFLSTLRKYEVCEKVLQLFSRGMLQEEFSRLNIQIQPQKTKQLQQPQQSQVMHMQLQESSIKLSQVQNIATANHNNYTNGGKIDENSRNGNNLSIDDSFYDVKNKGILSTLSRLMEMNSDKAASIDSTGGCYGSMIEEKQSYIDSSIFTSSNWSNTAPKTTTLLDKELFFNKLDFSNMFKKTSRMNEVRNTPEMNKKHDSSDNNNNVIKIKNETLFSLDARDHFYPELDVQEEGHDSLIVVRFNSGELGLQLDQKISSDGREVAVVSTLDTTHQVIKYGSKLVAINHRLTKGLSFNEQCRVMKALPRPMILSFIR